MTATDRSFQCSGTATCTLFHNCAVDVLLYCTMLVRYAIGRLRHFEAVLFHSLRDILLLCRFDKVLFCCPAGLTPFSFGMLFCHGALLPANQSVKISWITIKSSTKITAIAAPESQTKKPCTPFNTTTFLQQQWHRDNAEKSWAQTCDATVRHVHGMLQPNVKRWNVVIAYLQEGQTN